jgi:hypothetical protein
MRGTVILVLASILVGGAALAQSAAPNTDPADNPDANAAASEPTKSDTDQPQPQGRTGPIDTESGGAHPSSPQGDSPPGMQPRPDNPKEEDSKK